MAQLIEKINHIKQECVAQLTQCNTQQELENARVAYIGRNGKITALMAELKTLSVDEKRTAGPALNELKQWAQATFENKKKELARAQQQAKQLQEKHFDVTAYKYQPLHGGLHVLSTLVNELNNIFISMGYEIADGPEVVTDYYNFEALNIPDDHPARDEHDTFWLTQPGLLLRTHTSCVQAKEMEKGKLPLAVFAPGRVYRNEAVDASHDFMFWQGEFMFIDTDVSIAQLLATARAFLQAVFEKKDLNIRVRPGYFPFVEPGLEIDASCPFCTDGCSTCKKTGWIELLGAGLIHPNVLRSSGIDPEKYSGFACGFGISRIAMIKYGINDIRLLHSTKLDVLQQF